MDLKETYNLIAADWNKDHSGDDWWVAGVDAFTSFLKPGANILDAGCGAGTKSAVLARKGFNVIGIDFSEKMIEIAKGKIPEVQFRVVDLNDLSPLQEKFDAIFMQAVLLHFPKSIAPKIIKSLTEKLNSEGYFYIAVKGMRPDGKEEEVVTENDYGYAYERFFSYFKEDEVKGYLKDAGLEVVYSSSNLVGRTNWIQVVGKLLK